MGSGASRGAGNEGEDKDEDEDEMMEDVSCMADVDMTAEGNFGRHTL